MSETPLEVLLNIREDIGALRASSEATNNWLQQHVADDKALEARVSTLEHGAAIQVGSSKTWALVGAGAGALALALIELVPMILGRR